jgi:hypothetical protein
LGWVMMYRNVVRIAVAVVSAPATLRMKIALGTFQVRQPEL